MATYKIGQIKNDGNNLNSCLTRITGDFCLINSAYNLGGNMNEESGGSYVFQDLAWQINNGYFDNSKSYYLSFKIERVRTPYYSSEASDKLNFQITLTNENQTQTQVLVENIFVESYKEDDGNGNTIFYELMFTPELQDTFNTIVFKMVRGHEDYVELSSGRTFQTATYISTSSTELVGEQQVTTITIEPKRDTLLDLPTISSSEEDGSVIVTITPGITESGTARDSSTIGRRWLIGDDLNPDSSSATNHKIPELKLYEVNNLLTNGLPSSVMKIGVQTKPGTLIMVNKESIRVGRSGIYEVNNDINISEVGVAGYNGEIPKFLIDYAYYG